MLALAALRLRPAVLIARLVQAAMRSASMHTVQLSPGRLVCPACSRQAEGGM